MGVFAFKDILFSVMVFRQIKSCVFGGSILSGLMHKKACFSFLSDTRIIW